MADEVDIANDRAQQILDAKIASVRAKQRTEAPELCVDCEEPNLPERRALGLALCIDCARLQERRARLFP